MTHIQQSAMNSLQSSTPDVKSNRIASVKVTNVTSASEATIRLDGKDYLATAKEGSFQEGATTVKVHGMKNGVLEVSVVDARQSNVAQESTRPSQSAPHPALGRHMSASETEALHRFIQTHPGEADRVDEWLQALGKKQLPVTEAHLKAVRAALSPSVEYGIGTSSNLNGMASEVEQWFTRLPLSAQAEIEANLQQIQKLFAQGNKAEAQRMLEQILTQHAAPSSVIKGFQEQMQTFQRFIPMLSAAGTDTQTAGLVKEALTKAMLQSNMSDVLHEWTRRIHEADEPLQPMLTKAVEQARNAYETGRELSARGILEKALAQLPSQAPAQQMLINSANYVAQLADQLQVTPDVKTFLVTKVTQHMAEAEASFKNDQRFLLRQLTLFQNNTPVPHESRQNLLEASIRKLDHQLLKGDAMLYADMKTEKELMKASSQLTEARTALQRGDAVEAKRIVNQVQRLLESVQFRPSEQRLQRFVQTEGAFLQKEEPLLRQPQAAQVFGSGRQVLEQVRQLGMTYEADVAKALVRNDAQAMEQSQRSLKAFLLQQWGTDADASAKSAAESQLLKLNGQQLLSKPDQGSLQHLFFSLPTMLGQKAGDMQVYVKGRNQGERVDWENCNVTFMLETEHLGEVAIHVTSQSRNLTVTIQNNTPHLSEAVAPLLKKTEERLADIGYNVSGMRFEPLQKTKTEASDHAQTSKSTNSKAGAEQKGYDVSI
ncbi:hypothetical protein G4V62_08170 [Bacillaceae bacterium SIJ1]|uniref:hypothetical protein n=1 Tax=Litoribacterium kuwaitense TaxID=1398745 RepID=UPI0013EC0315|nr:hypothetical protein [Litoribacterium kuwaitense]NGP44935.1 hypothetical protein [Litoribacterium kuwaitense]